MHWDNVAVRETGVAGVPPIYFHGIATGIYLTFLAGVRPARCRYATRHARARLHQARFREQVLAAYGTRCTLCTPMHRALLDAAHIIPDNEPDSRSIVPNGLAVCKIHHSAFDANIIGIRPGAHPEQHAAEVRGDILREIDGPMLRHGIQVMHGRRLWLPPKPEHRPNPSFLKYRYERFRAAT
jgi:putative restriction endonuclease